MSAPLHSRFRKKLRELLNITLSKLSSPNNSSKIDTDDIKRVLIVRVNYRIGNIIFMTPLINALAKKIPHAKVDMMVGSPFTAPIIKDMPNIKNIYPMPRELTKNPLKLHKEIKKINKNSYDLVINPVAGSVTSNIATFLLKSKLKLGFYKKDTWMPINRSITVPKHIKHEALKPLALMDIFSGEKLNYDRFLDIKLSKHERDEGKKVLNDLIKNQNKSKIITLFRDARGDKKVDKSWWEDLIKQMQKIDSSITFIDILSPDVKEPLFKNMLNFSSKNLRDLAKMICATDTFICGDTGPMHLASASLTPTIALFNKTNPSVYGPLGERDKAIDTNNKDLQTIAKEIFRHLELYTSH